MSLIRFSCNIYLMTKLLLLISTTVPAKTDDFNPTLQYTYASSPAPEFPPNFSNKPFIFDNKLYLPPDTQNQPPLPYFNAGEPASQFLPIKDQTMLNAYQSFFDHNSDWPGQLNGMFVQTPAPFQNYAQTTTTIKPKDEVKSDFNFKSNFTLNDRGPKHALPEIITGNPYPTTTRAIPTPAITGRTDFQPDLLVTPKTSYSGPINNVRRTLIHQTGAEFNPQLTIGEPIPDQYQTASSQQGDYIAPYPGIPILRQISEMDLDGSFSYESLSGDQTHVVQHGHVENLGTDDEEQVVQGSYSFVGDDGQTYSVHYIADGNGFRASGDHLPVAPPVPEIIQKSVEYNMAEEAKKTQSTQHYQNINNIDDNASKPAQVRQQKPFIETKPPAAFSISNTDFTNGLHASGSNQYINYLQAPASFSTPTPQKQASPRLFTISPQLTFPASQGAYVPSRPIQTSSKTYTPLNTETTGSSFGTPQPGTTRGNYVAPHTETEHSSKLWQYQRTYLPNGNKFLNKSSISRGDYLDDQDDVLINFEDMSPEDYSKAYFSHIAPQNGNPDSKQNGLVPPTNYIKDNADWNSVINAKSFLPEPQTVTISYNYQQNQGKDKIVKTSKGNDNFVNNYDDVIMKENVPQKYWHITHDAQDSLKPSLIANSNSIFKPAKSPNTNNVNFNGEINYSNNIQSQNKNSTREPTEESNSLPQLNLPAMKANEHNKKNKVASNTESLKPFQFEYQSKLGKTPEPSVNIMEAIKENLFLKPILERSKKNLASSHNVISKKSELSKEQFVNKHKPQEDIKSYQKHTKLTDEINQNKLDLAQIIALLNVKSNFESSKLKRKPESDNIKSKYESNFDDKQIQHQQKFNIDLDNNSNWKKFMTTN